jgi:hypothetical protein
MKYILLFLMSVSAVYAADTDSRYCTINPLRTTEGKIARSSSEIAKFKRVHPCPVNNRKYGSCPGWNIDHIIPLANGGCDKIHNMQWLPVEIKRCSSDYCKDRWELRVYKKPEPSYN